MNIIVKPGAVKVTDIVANHFCADTVSADEIKSAYDRCGRILSNPEQFPNADVEYLLELEDALFEQAPTACDMGL